MKYLMIVARRLWKLESHLPTLQLYFRSSTFTLGSHSSFPFPAPSTSHTQFAPGIFSVTMTRVGHSGVVGELLMASVFAHHDERSSEIRGGFMTDPFWIASFASSLDILFIESFAVLLATSSGIPAFKLSIISEALYNEGESTSLAKLGSANILFTVSSTGLPELWISYAANKSVKIPRIPDVMNRSISW